MTEQMKMLLFLPTPECSNWSRQHFLLNIQQGVQHGDIQQGVQHNTLLHEQALYVGKTYSRQQNEFYWVCDTNNVEGWETASLPSHLYADATRLSLS